MPEPSWDQTDLYLQPATPTWWSHYSANLAENGISATSRAVIDVDASFIVDQGVLGAGTPGSSGWPVSRARSGVVMGAVQSGKTASMLAVIAKAIDKGVDVVVVLAGTRTALWQQTFARLVAQLDPQHKAWRRRLLIPTKSVLSSDAFDLPTLYNVPQAQIERTVASRLPIIAVVMKNVFHLERAAATLQKSVFPAAHRRGDSFHILVIDDEADDSSILDAVSEQKAGVALADTKQIPRRIADLWEARTAPGQTSYPNLYATYVAYTATPQANFLQAATNPLAPRDFAFSLRTPGRTGALVPRTPSYTDVAGLKSWYTGAEIFYRSLASVPICRSDDPTDEIFANALRSFLVASAVRLWRDPERIGPASAQTRVHATRAEAKARNAHPASMLIHPSSAKEDHFDVAAAVLAWSDGSDTRIARARIAAGERHLSIAGIRQQMDRDPGPWQSWLTSFIDSAYQCHVVLGLPKKPPVPALDDWPQIRRLILEEVVPGTQLAVVNSDDAADDKPDFEPGRRGEGWGPPQNHSTIFVSGNVMARGLTLEGLSTTLFTRASDTPLADTQMQMQRWFGYRGSIIDLCRVFLTSAQLQLFVEYHETDQALRTDILAAMNQGTGGSGTVTVLQGYQFSATGKIARITAEPLWPGPSPFLGRLNEPAVDIVNSQVVADLLTQGCDVVTAPRDGHPLGLLLHDDLDLLATAALLESLVWPPGESTETDMSTRHRWQSLERQLGLSAPDPAWPLLRAPDPTNKIGTGPSPYLIAAYLRAWSACLTRHAPGLSTTDAPGGPWSLVDLHQRHARQPRFRIGLRFGRGPEPARGPLTVLDGPVTLIDRQVRARTVVGTWGSRGAAGSNDPLTGPGRYPGDEYFDYFARGEQPPLGVLGAARPPGTPGLVLFHPIRVDQNQVSIAVGVVIPLGGPDQVAATVQGD